MDNQDSYVVFTNINTKISLPFLLLVCSLSFFFFCSLSFIVSLRMGNSSPSSGSLIGLKPKLVRNESTRKKKNETFIL